MMRDSEQPSVRNSGPGQGASPVIIIGMHRSGTSFLTGLLRDMGLFVGRFVQRNNEPFFFMDRNEKVLSACGGDWDNPGVVKSLLGAEPLCALIAGKWARELDGIHALPFMGPQLYLSHRSVFRLRIPWGWKEPRTTALLPLWLRVFPNAKILHIYRNGIDVAASLMVRERARVAALTHGESESRKKPTAGNPGKQDRFQRLMSVFRRRHQKLEPLHRYRRLGVRPCIDLEYGFNLWRTYVEMGFRFTAGISNPVLAVRYEDFLNDPGPIVRDLQDFCGLKRDGQKISAVLKKIRPERRWAFRDAPDLLDFYESKKDDPWMKTLGYDAII
jgi:hypothetical protein